MKISSYTHNGKKTIIINPFGKLFFFTLPSIRRLKVRIVCLFLTVKSDSDCDGSAVTWEDRLTGGRIYYARRWNYTSVGGSCGHTVNWFLG